MNISIFGKNHKMRRVLFFLIVSFVVTYCSRKKTTEAGNQTTLVLKTIKPPAFSADSAYFFIQKQLHYGPRVPNSKGHKQCGDYLIAQFKDYNAQVTIQSFQATTFTNETLHLRNIIASYNTSKKKRIILAAHWDTRPFADKDEKDKNKPIDGANDGGSGVAVLLEIARILSTQADRFPTGIDIILFDGEDYGPLHDQSIDSEAMYWCLGSQYWAKNKHQTNYGAYYGILLDMVGAREATFLQESYSLHYAGEIVKKVWNTAEQLGYGAYFSSQNSGGGIQDDHVAVNEIAAIPMIDIIDDFSSKAYHHTHLDQLDIIDHRTLQAVGETILYVIINEN